MTLNQTSSEALMNTTTSPRGNRAYKNKDGNWAVHTEIEINATPEQVWAVMTDFDTLSEWSNGLIAYEGKFQDGVEARIVYRVNRFFKIDLVRRIKVDKWMFGWYGPYIGIGVDDHEYRVEPLDSGQRTRFIQSDMAASLLGKFLGRAIVNFDVGVFDSFNQVLKERVETLVRTGRI